MQRDSYYYVRRTLLAMCFESALILRLAAQVLNVQTAVQVQRLRISSSSIVIITLFVYDDAFDLSLGFAVMHLPTCSNPCADCIAFFHDGVVSFGGLP